MAENIIVAIIVGMVTLLAGRSFYRTVTGQSDGCACSRSGCRQIDSCNQSYGVKADPGSMAPGIDGSDPRGRHRDL